MTLESTVGRLSQLKLLRRCLGHPYLVLTRWMWKHLPASFSSSPWAHSYGRHCQGLVRLQGPRTMSIGTLFLRNRPELELLRRVLDQRPRGDSVKLAVLACSKGAEVYSIGFTIRSARPDLNLSIKAVDISQEILEFAERGVYSLQSLGPLQWPDTSLIASKGELAWHTWRGQNVSLFERMSTAEQEALFDREADRVTIKSQFRKGIDWLQGDAGDPGLADRLGPQDVVMAKNFLCHLKPRDAEKCLRNVPRLLKPGGYLFVSGVDLDVRTKVAMELGWHPVTELIEEIHEGDPSLRTVWPWNYCGLEPFNRKRSDWQIRYASVFQMGRETTQKRSDG